MSPDDGLPASKDDEGASGVDPASAEDAPLRRRMFLRKMTTDAVMAGGWLTGSARMIRSATAASETLHREFEARPAPIEEPVTGADRPDPPTGPAAEAVTASRPWTPWSPPLTAAQEALLASALPAALASAQAGHAPHLTASPFHWDGAVFRISALDWSARTLNIQIDARVSLLIADPHGGLSVSATGRATVLTGPAAQDETLPILRKYGGDGSALAERWAELNVDGDRLVIVVVPEHMVWRSDEPAWRSIAPSETRGS
jgi:Pyridoxamine 5'-phosphate oxidase